MKSCKWCGLVKGAYEQAAAEIERGEHLPKGKP